LLPWRAVASGIVTAGLLALAIGVLASPEDVPGLTVPGSPEAGQAMDGMGMEGEAMPSGGGMDEAMPPGGGMGDAMP
ncbi:MAG TPA: hypothetical protein VHF58_01820, partial [Solirubrobacterales bacterium]|nr:hypothetical protein [Solirubrobacterales bacterium]